MLHGPEGVVSASCPSLFCVREALVWSPPEVRRSWTPAGGPQEQAEGTLSARSWAPRGQSRPPACTLPPGFRAGWLGPRWQRAVFEGAKQCHPRAEGTEAGSEGCVGGCCLPSGGRIGWAQGSGVPEYPLGAGTLASGFSGSSRPPLSPLPAMGEPWWRVILGPACCESPRQGRWWAPSGRHSQAPPTHSTAASGHLLPCVCPDGQATGHQGTRQGPRVGWVLPRGPCQRGSVARSLGALG